MYRLWLFALTTVLAAPIIAGDLGKVTILDSGPATCRAEQTPLTLSEPTRCMRLGVRCPNTLARAVTLRVTSPPDGVPRRGTVICGLGGTGEGWYEASQPARELLDDLVAEGFRVVQRAWEEPGWFEGSSSMNDASCRYATLITWIHQNPALVEPGTALVVTGNSGGSAEIGYALSRWDRDQIIDLAVPTGGPPMGWVHKGCTFESDSTWAQRCNRGLDKVGVCPQGQGNHKCGYNPLQKERIIDAAFDLSGTTPCHDGDVDVLHHNSILYPGADLDHPQTAVHFLIGEDDCGSTPALAGPYIKTLVGTSELHSATLLAETGHTVPTDEVGANAIFETIMAEGFFRH